MTGYNLMPGVSDLDTEPADVVHEERFCTTCGFEAVVEITQYVDRDGLHESWVCHLGHEHSDILEHGDSRDEYEPDQDWD